MTAICTSHTADLIAMSRNDFYKLKAISYVWSEFTSQVHEKVNRYANFVIKNTTAQVLLKDRFAKIKQES